MKKDVIRIGDTIRVLKPLWVKRVGYPLVWTDLIDEVQQDPRTRQALEVLGIYEPLQQRDGNRLTFLSIDPNEEHPHEFVRAVARLRVEQRRFGGNVRSIHYVPLAPEGSWLDMLLTHAPHHGYVGREFEVLGKRIAKTGTRFAASGSDEDWEPGGLENCRTHILLKTWAGEIEACNVEKVKP